jgi:hypothetical protein
MTYENKLIKNNFTDVKRHAEFLESIKKGGFSKILNIALKIKSDYKIFLLKLNLAQIYSLKKFRINYQVFYKATLKINS